jgi:hypothetical protein
VSSHPHSAKLEPPSSALAMVIKNEPRGQMDKIQDPKKADSNVNKHSKIFGYEIMHKNINDSI